MPISVELMRDSSCWMKAPDVEAFLETLQTMTYKNSYPNLIEKVGHLVPQLRAWGVLDSVLRMMPRPQEIFHQPERFLSYFISPEPPVESVVRTEDELSFALPLPSQQYPLTSLFLKSAFESLPLYTGQSLAHCEWNDIFIKIKWPRRQGTMFTQDPGHQISPELLSHVIDDLQKSQRELEEKNRELQTKNEELMQTYKELQGHLRNKPTDLPNIESELSMYREMNEEPLHKV